MCMAAQDKQEKQTRQSGNNNNMIILRGLVFPKRQDTITNIVL